MTAREIRLTPLPHEWNRSQAECQRTTASGIFNDLYLAVTRAVGVEFANGRFEDPAFFSRLAPVFSKLYFDAFERDAAMGTLSRVWAPLFEKRSEAGIAPLQFAIAGHERPHQLRPCDRARHRRQGARLRPRAGSAHHRDHLRVNTTLARVMDDLKEGFETGMARTVVQALGTLDQIRIIERARDHAWTRAQNLVALDNAPFVREQYLHVLARTVGFASRALLGQRWARPAAATARAGTAVFSTRSHGAIRRLGVIPAVVRARP